MIPTIRTYLFRLLPEEESPSTLRLGGLCNALLGHYPFFDSGSAKLNGDGSEMLITLAQELGNLPNKLSTEGHTDSQPYAPSAAYGNWELSAERANAARRVMQGNGIGADQVTQVRGFADQRLRKPDAPLDLQPPHLADRAIHRQKQRR